MQNLCVPETENPEALTVEPRGSPGVFRLLLGMLPSIHLDDELSLKGNEVYYVRTDRRLTAELEALDLAHPEMFPEQSLRIRRIGPEMLCFILHRSPIRAVCFPLAVMTLSGGFFTYL